MQSKEEKKQYWKSRYLKNADKFRLRAKEYYKANSKRIILYQKKYLYGVTPEQYEYMKTSQNNECAICGEIFVEIPHIDHNHVTKKVRQLLCPDCNHMLGYAKDNSKTLRIAADYIDKWGKV